MVIDGLHVQGYEVIEAADADEALLCLERDAAVDLLFTDIAMPGRMTGVDLALEVRARWPQIPVLFTTGYSDRSVLARWPARIDLLAKPYAQQALAWRVRASLDGARTARFGQAVGGRAQAP